jgi:hypothetical protein
MDSTEVAAGGASDSLERFAELWWEASPEVDAAPSFEPMDGRGAVVIRAERV